MRVLTDQLQAAVDEICAADPSALADGETVVGLQRQLSRLEAAATQAAAAFDASRAWEADGARSAAGWIAVACHLPKATARRRVQLGRELRHMPIAEQAWLAGDIDGAHVALLARSRTDATAEQFGRHEEILVGYARDLRFGRFVRVMAYWRYRADPDGAEANAESQLATRRLHLSSTFGDMRVLDGLFDPIGGAIYEAELKRLEKQLFDEDWAEAKARVGDGVCAADLRRTPAQRRADAAVEMARRSAATPAGSRMPEPLFSVFIDFETLAGMICELSDGTVVTPGSLVPYLDRAWLERIVFASPSRVMDVGVRRRLFTGATRRAILVRDRECFHPFCDLPAEDCEVDHIEPHAAGGLTVEQNGRPACTFHNRARHRRT